MEVNAIVALLRSHQFELARQQWEKTDKRTPALKGIGAYFYLKDKKYEEALKLIEVTDTFTCFLRSHILLAMKRPKDAIQNLIQASGKEGQLSEHGLLKNDGYVIFLLRAAFTHSIDPSFVQEHLISQIDYQSTSDTILLHVSEYLSSCNNLVESEKILKIMYSKNQQSIDAQARLL